jgi:sugar diacid utilization regulator/GAF domain-containing protein
MRRDLLPTPHERLSHEMIRLLHEGAPAEALSQRLAELEALPDTLPDKSAMVEAVHMAMAVRNRLELHERREQGLLAVIESAQDLSSRLDLTDLLGAIVARARKLLGSDLAWLSVHDADRGEFRVLIVEGALALNTSAMVAHRDRGVVSVVMSSRLPFTTPDYLHDKRFSHDPRLDDTFRDEGIAALVGVPLIWEDEVIGLLFLADRYHRTHTAQSVSILCTLATHGAVALKNARDFERASAALARADAARDELERHLRGIQAAADAHEQMTSLLAKGASLATLSQSIAQRLGGAVLVLDEAAQLICRTTAPGFESAAASAYEPFGTPGSEIARAQRLSRQSGRSVPAEAIEGEHCRVMSVIGGDDILGAVVLFHRGELDDVAVRTFERSASVIGVVLLSQERMEAAKHRSVSALVRALIAPRQDDAAMLADRAGRHGLDLAQPLSLMLVAMEAPGASYAARRFRTLAPLSGVLAGVLVDDVDGLLLMLSNTTRAGDLRQAVAQTMRHEFDPGYRGVISRPAAGAAELPALYATLRRALSVLGRIGVQGHVVDQNELAMYSTLFETHDQSSLAHYLDATIGALIAHDRKRQSELAATLLCYFDHNQNAKTTAQRLDIHVNTVRQRLATIEDLLGYWGHASRVLEIHVALRLWKLSRPLEAGG